MAKVALAEYENEHENMCKCSCTLYIALFSVLVTINIGIAAFLFTTSKCIIIKKKIVAKEGSVLQATICWTYKNDCK